MNRITLMLVPAMLLATPAQAQQVRCYDDAKGNSLGTSVTPSGQTRRGVSTGSSSTSAGGTATFYDARGNVVGRSSAPPR
jgi:hypothetical protein